jgi:hypothetical protein
VVWECESIFGGSFWMVGPPSDEKSDGFIIYDYYMEKKGNSRK